MRGRSRSKGPNPLTRAYESNGPDVKIRGTAQHVADKYAQLARDATASGDPVAAENYLQHAEHYYRIIAAAQEQFRQQFGTQQRFDEDGEDGDEDGQANGYGYAAGDRGGPGDEYGEGPGGPAYDPRFNGNDRPQQPQPRYERQDRPPQDRPSQDRPPQDRMPQGDRGPNPNQNRNQRFDRGGDRNDRPNGERYDRNGGGERFDRNGPPPNGGGERYERPDNSGERRDRVPRNNGEQRFEANRRDFNRNDRPPGGPVRPETQRLATSADDQAAAVPDALPAFLMNPVRPAIAITTEERADPQAASPAFEHEGEAGSPAAEPRPRRRRARRSDVSSEGLDFGVAAEGGEGDKLPD